MDGLSAYIQNVTNLAVTFGVIFSYLQIKKVSKSIEIGQKANLISALHFFSSEYDSIMLDSLGCGDRQKADIWYFRYWNLLTNEFLFFQQGLLDDYIFEFWSFKLCLFYDSKPHNISCKDLDSYRESHLKYMENHNGSCPHTDLFFKELMAISQRAKSEEEVRKEVHGLIKKYRNLR
ncbi:MAG: hypothetical protein PHI66_02695 [Candidatus Pacebacteria bacterium]|nr:hypothetical protein [Candidatus Paceibacterota bacterium]